MKSSKSMRKSNYFFGNYKLTKKYTGFATSELDGALVQSKLKMPYYYKSVLHFLSGWMLPCK